MVQLEVLLLVAAAVGVVLEMAAWVRQILVVVWERLLVVVEAQAEMRCQWKDEALQRSCKVLYELGGNRAKEREIGTYEAVDVLGMRELPVLLPQTRMCPPTPQLKLWKGAEVAQDCEKDFVSHFKADSVDMVRTEQGALAAAAAVVRQPRICWVKLVAVGVCCWSRKKAEVLRRTNMSDLS